MRRLKEAGISIVILSARQQREQADLQRFRSGPLDVGVVTREDGDAGRRCSVEFFTLRNTAIMGLVQVGMIVAGVLGAGAVYKWYTSVGLTPPSQTALLSEYGFLALVLPVAWTAWALYALYRWESSEKN